MKEIYKSPLNYVGGKYKLLPVILSYFPNNIDTFVDLFAGGLDVSINVKANNIIANDINKYIIDIYKFFADTDKKIIFTQIDYKINEFNLSKINFDGYLKLRKQYNNEKNPLDLFLLSCYSFNHQIRFNNSFNFNTPFGKNRSSYNPKIKNNLENFIDILHQKKISFYSLDFRKINVSFLKSGDVVYCDPPYLVSTGPYNDGKRGYDSRSDKEESDLLDLLDYLHSKGIIFYLSNVLINKGLKNDLLIKWSSKYKVIHVKKSYANCNYHRNSCECYSDEVLITNYEK